MKTLPAAGHRQTHVCPRCHGAVYRIPRRALDLLISVFVSVRRYRCDTMGCSWQGNQRHKQRAVSGHGHALATPDLLRLSLSGV
jgi:hypothetical protein